MHDKYFNFNIPFHKEITQILEEAHFYYAMPCTHFLLQKTFGIASGGKTDQKPKLTSPPPKAQNNMFDQMFNEIQRQQQHLSKSQGAAPSGESASLEAFKSQGNEPPTRPIRAAPSAPGLSKDRDGLFSPEMQKNLKDGRGAELSHADRAKDRSKMSSLHHQHSLPTEMKYEAKPDHQSRGPASHSAGASASTGEPGQRSHKPADLPPLITSPAKSTRSRTASQSSDISPTVAKMRKDDRRLSQDPVVKLGPKLTSIDVKSPPVPVAPEMDILAFCEQAASGKISPPPVQPSPTKPIHKLKFPSRTHEKSNTPDKVIPENPQSNNTITNTVEKLEKEKRDQKHQEAMDTFEFVDVETVPKKERPLEKERRSHLQELATKQQHKALEKVEKSDLKMKISLSGSPNVKASPTLKAVKSEESKRSSPSLETSTGLKMKISGLGKMNSSVDKTDSPSRGDKDKGGYQVKSEGLKLTLKLGAGLTPPPPAEGEKREKHHRHHKKHKHKEHKHRDREKGEERHSRKRAYSPGGTEIPGHHSSKHREHREHHHGHGAHPPSSKMPRSDSLVNNSVNAHAGNGNSENTAHISKIKEAANLLGVAIQQKMVNIQRAQQQQEGRRSGLRGHPAPPPPPPNNPAPPPLPPGPPPS